jgi:hypothetical protein
MRPVKADEFIAQDAHEPRQRHEIRAKISTRSPNARP